jgi:hypothetical protein
MARERARTRPFLPCLQVSIARVYNWDVQQRREAKLAGS